MFEIPPDSNTFDEGPVNDRIFDKELMKPPAGSTALNSRGRDACDWGEGIRSLRTPRHIF